MADLIIRYRQSEPTYALNLVLDGTVPSGETTSVIADVYWRWEDDTSMEPQYLGSTVAGHDLVVPFKLDTRQIRLFAVSRTGKGEANVTSIKESTQTTFLAGGPAVIADISFGAPDVTLTIANNGGTGDIHILRRTGSDDFAELTSVASSTTSYVDTPDIDGTYDYELVQDGQTGTSNIASIAVTGSGGSTGSVPDGLSGTYDGVSTVALSWVNHGATGSIFVERKVFGRTGEPYLPVATLSSATTSHNDTVTPDVINVVYNYRVRNTSIAGYSNVIDIFVASA